MIHRLQQMLRVGRVKLVDESGPIGRVQIDEGDLGKSGGRRIIDKVARVAHFGFAAVPPIGSEVMLASPAGDRTQTIAIGSNHQPSRLKDLKPGDSGIYDVRGAKVTLTADGLLIDCAGLPALVQNCPTITLHATEKVTVDAPLVEVLHDLTVGGDASIAGTAAITGDTTVGGALNTSGEITGDSGGSIVTLGGLHVAYNAHKHGGVKTGSDTSGGTDHPV